MKREVLTKRKKRRIEQITGRDTRTIKHYLKVIKHNRDNIVTKTRNGETRVNKSKLDKLTLTTTKGKDRRTTVTHDMKKKFSRSSHDELQECRDKAVAIFNSQNQVNSRQGKLHSHHRRKIPRTQSANKERFKLVCVNENKSSEESNKLARWWVGIRDSLDTNINNSNRHQRLWLPLALSPYHEKEMKKGKFQALELLYYPHTKEWWIHLIILITPQNYHSCRPPAVLGIDLGINKRAATALLTPRKRIYRREIKFWSGNLRKRLLEKYDEKLAQWQKKERKTALNSKEYVKTLLTLRNVRKRFKCELAKNDNEFAKKLVKYILSLSKKYDLYVVIGYPYHIRNQHRRGNKHPRHRKRVHRWNYRRIIALIKYKLALKGFQAHRVLAISESWTSKTCSKCGTYNTLRSHQSSFVCLQCGYKLNADLNGAKNISKRLISYVLEPKYSTIKDQLTGRYFKIDLFRGFNVFSQWLNTCNTLSSSTTVK
ncbi:hypothetical protein ES708_20968 [subsurface metagenome]